MVMQLFPTGAPVSLSGATLIMPAVAHANVGELATDLLIATLRPQLVGRLEDENVLSCVGNDPYDLANPGLLTTCLELYQLQGAQPCVYILQQRAPAMKGQQSQFAQNMAAWMKSQRVSQVLLLCGLDAQFRKDRQIMGPSTRFLSEAGPLQEAATALGWLRLEDDVQRDEREVHGLLPPWPMVDYLRQSGIACLLLACFATEGDNVPDATMVAECALQLLDKADIGPGLQRNQLAMPCSFVSLYGRAPREEIY